MLGEYNELNHSAQVNTLEKFQAPHCDNLRQILIISFALLKIREQQIDNILARHIYIKTCLLNNTELGAHWAINVTKKEKKKQRERKEKNTTMKKGREKLTVSRNNTGCW